MRYTYERAAFTELDVHQRETSLEPPITANVFYALTTSRWIETEFQLLAFVVNDASHKKNEPFLITR
ncbi:hypothetical protein J6590_041908 [Homalodisca vitripennis]|nr:hypothetical protein J6590_041908 [Homalodisca vitripennis]